VSARESAIIYSGSVIKRGEAKCVVVKYWRKYLFREDCGTGQDCQAKIPPGTIMLAIVKYMMFLGIGALILVAIYAVIIGTGSFLY